VIDYKKTSFEDRVHDVDVVFDTIGGKTLEDLGKYLGKEVSLCL
jgi:NADPH:quinone reductase-like Zn-dependent oxidoreductase